LVGAVFSAWHATVFLLMTGAGQANQRETRRPADKNFIGRESAATF
jgi:hypothetical protein